MSNPIVPLAIAGVIALLGCLACLAVIAFAFVRKKPAVLPALAPVPPAPEGGPPDPAERLTLAMLAEIDRRKREAERSEVRSKVDGLIESIVPAAADETEAAKK